MKDPEGVLQKNETADIEIEWWKYNEGNKLEDCVLSKIVLEY